MPSKLYESAMAFLKTFEKLDADDLVSLRASDCIQRMAPASLGLADVVWTNEVVHSFYASVHGIHTSCIFTIHEVVEDEKNHKIAIWLTSHSTYSELEVPDGGGEYVFILTFDDNDEKVKHFIQFLDVDRARGETKRVNMSKAIIAKRDGTKPDFVVNPDWLDLKRQ